MSKIILKGSIHGTKKIKTYSQPDILHSKVDKVLAQSNEFSIRYNQGKNNFYIYHYYDAYDNNLNKIYSGRWYISDFIPDAKSFNSKDQTLNILLKKVPWEDFDTGKTKVKNVKIKIFFTQKGYDKITKFINKCVKNKN